MRNFFVIGLFVVLCSCEQSAWNESEQNEFMKGCLEETDDESYCRCYMQNVMEKYPQAEDSKKMSFEEAYEFAKDCD